MDKILITDLVARGVIGVSEREREKPQEILLNITLFADTTSGGASDNIEDCVNYRTVAKQAIALAETAQRFTVEALASDLAQMCLKDPRVVGVIIRVEKPGAVRFARSVGVEIERGRTA